MTTGRRNARRQAVFVLYQQDLLSLGASAAVRRAGELQLDPYGRRLVGGVEEKRQLIDALLQEHVTGWDLERLGILERAILRVAAYELRWEKEVPEAVVINEAVALAKRFCSGEAGALVNGVLGSLLESSAEPDPAKSVGQEGR